MIQTAGLTAGLATRIAAPGLLVSMLILASLPLASASASESTDNNPLFRLSQASFTRITVEQGLTENTIDGLTQDDQGFIWIGTQDGVNRYDAHGFRHFRQDADDPDSLVANSVNELLFAEGRVWVATDRGIDSIDTRTEAIQHHPLPDLEPGRRVDTLALDGQGGLLIASAGRIYRLDLDGYAIRELARSDEVIDALAVSGNDILVGTESGLYRVEPSSKRLQALVNPARSLDVNGIWVDSPEAIWLATSGGLWQVTSIGEVLNRYTRNANDSNSLSLNQVNTVLRDSNGVLWIGTRDGLNKLDERSGEFQRFYNEPSDPTSLSSNLIYELFEDQSGTLWVGTFYGVNIKRQRGTQFGLLKNNPNSGRSILDNTIFSITSDNTGRYWIGSAEGISVVDAASGRIDIIDEVTSDDGQPPYVITLELGPEGDIWAGTVFNGLHRIDTDTLEVGPSGLVMDTDFGLPVVTEILRDRNDRLWAAHHYLYTKDPGQQDWQRFPLELTEEARRRAIHLAEDPAGFLWVASLDGLARISLDDNSITRIDASEPVGPNGLQRREMLAISVDSSGRAWFGSDGGGLGLVENARTLTADTARVRYIDRSDGLTNDVVYGILEDGAGDLWLSSNRGLTRYNPETGSVQHFGPAHGLQSLEFNESAVHASPDGLFLFGGPLGITFFDPAVIKREFPSPQVRLVEIEVGGEPRRLGDDGVLRLSHEDNIVRIEFVALNYADPASSRYEYRLVGFSDDWLHLNESHEVSFTNLDPGEYEFQVRSSSVESDAESKVTRLSIAVEPAWWQTIWAYLGGLALMLVGLYLLVRQRVAAHRNEVIRERKNAERLEQLVDERTRELAAKSKALETASITDMLTKIHNRRYLYSRIDQDLALVRRRYADGKGLPNEKSDIAFFMIDIDNFKQINDTYGHVDGDLVLMETAKALQKVCRVSDTVVRWGGEEFVVVAMETNRKMIPVMAERMRKACDSLDIRSEDGRPIAVTCSIGATPYPFDPRDRYAIDSDGLLSLADYCMFAAKRFGKNGWVCVDHEPSKEAMGLRVRSFSELAEAVRQREVRITSSFDESEQNWSAERDKQYD
ncbi:MAG: diguanylate cyclase [Gammaproteobacteria bacterium]|nr:diguanylate cyclase [Gammaproteobacteria bacterium]